MELRDGLQLEASGWLETSEDLSLSLAQGGSVTSVPTPDSEKTLYHPI